MKSNAYVLGGIATVLLVGTVAFLPQTEVKGVSVRITPTVTPTTEPTETPIPTAVPTLTPYIKQVVPTHVIIVPTATPEPQKEPEQKVTVCEKDCPNYENSVTVVEDTGKKAEIKITN